MSRLDRTARARGVPKGGGFSPRLRGDVFQGWAGFLVASEAVQRWNFLHNIAWYSDPDVMLVRPPLTEGMARAWATIGWSGPRLLRNCCSVIWR